jgi:hypothetical protein
MSAETTIDTQRRRSLFGWHRQEATQVAGAQVAQGQ